MSEIGNDVNTLCKEKIQDEYDLGMARRLCGFVVRELLVGLSYVRDKRMGEQLVYSRCVVCRF